MSRERRIKVGIDLAPASLTHRAPGTARHVTAQARALFKLNVPWQWVPLVESTSNPLWPEVQHLSPIAVRGWKFSTRATWSVGRVWKQQGCALGFATAYFVPLRGVPVVANFFDANVFDFAAAWSGSGRSYNAKLNALLMRAALRRAEKLFVLSAYSRDRLASRFTRYAEKLVITPCGVDLLPPPQKPAWAARVTRPYVLYVGAFSENKNQVNLLRAWAAVQRTLADAPALVLVGPTQSATAGTSYYAQAIDPILRELPRAHEVIVTGAINDAELAWAYNRALFYIHPSYAEGFGLPVIEAMSYGVAVACSKTTSLPEVAGNAATYFDPSDARSIAAAVVELAGDENARRKLGAAGRARAAQFTWENNACAVAEQIEQTLTRLN